MKTTVRKIILGFTVILIAVLRSAASAEMITIDASKDATIYGGAHTDNSNGAGPGIFSGTDGMTTPLRSLLAFDVADSVPSGATIVDVQLRLALGLVAGSGGGMPGPDPVTIQLRRLTTGWGEGPTGSSATMINTTGQGFPASPGDATWSESAYSSHSWATAGGDYSETISASASIGNVLTTTDNNTYYTWGSTSSMVADVQDWLDDSGSNFGWILINTNEDSVRTFRAFYTREAATAAFHPQLHVTYTMPNNGDFDDNGFVDADDIDILWAIVRGGGPDPNDDDDEDLNGDGFVNEKDVDYLLANLLTAGGNRQYGDADLDGGVGGLDFTAWRLRAGTGWANGDFDGDGGVGGLDFTLWRTRPTAYPGTVGTHSDRLAAVPEPATVVLLGAGISLLAVRRWLCFNRH